jgi:hypothetical protein
MRFELAKYEKVLRQSRPRSDGRSVSAFLLSLLRRLWDSSYVRFVRQDVS